MLIKPVTAISRWNAVGSSTKVGAVRLTEYGNFQVFGVDRDVWGAM